MLCWKTHTSHAGFMKRWEGEQGRIYSCSILQQQLDAIQTSSCTRITQRRATIDVTSIHLKDRAVMTAHMHHVELPPKPPTVLDSLVTCRSQVAPQNLLTCAPASSSSLTHWACPCIQASCRGVMESTATMLTAAPPSISCCNWKALPCAAASCTADRSVQNPRPCAAKMWNQTKPKSIYSQSREGGWGDVWAFILLLSKRKARVFLLLIKHAALNPMSRQLCIELPIK